jgi:cysteine desulfurase
MIYMDYNATTPIAEEVAQEMQSVISSNYGNPSSSHKLGIAAKRAVEESREKVAELIGCTTKEIIFTSGGSESNNMVIKGVAQSYKHKGNHIITCITEHPAVLNPCRYLERIGYEVTYIGVDCHGFIRLSELEKALRPETILVTIMHSNNETGTIQPIKEVSKLCRRYEVLFHTDASQSVGKVPVNVKDLDVDFLTVAGHKLYAPKGIGALYIREGLYIEPLIHGAGHEFGKRAGTENVIFNAALGKACEIAKASLEGKELGANSLNIHEIKALTDYLFSMLKEGLKDKIILNGHPEKRLPNTLNISFPGYDGNELINKLGDVALSTGSACHSGQTAVSLVLQAMGVTEEAGRGAIRFSLGRYTTKKEVDYVMERLIEKIQ